MSRVLDQIIMEDVARSCPEPFLAYQKCMQSPEIKDKRECGKYQMALQKCVKEQVPSFQKIQKNCLGWIQQYEKCLRENRDDYSSKCFETLRGLRTCSAQQVGGDSKLEKKRKMPDLYAHQPAPKDEKK